MRLPTTSKHVRVDLLHPTFKARLDAFFKHPEIAGQCAIVSGVRSYADQKYFWDLYQSGKGNLAANPDRYMSNGKWKGSYHMQQPDGYGHAVDLRIIGRKLTRARCAEIAKTYGIVQTVRSEWWHMQWQTHSKVFAAPAMKGAKTETKTAKKAKVNLKGVAAALAEMREKIALYPLRKGARNSLVRTLQELLNAKNFGCGFPDGIWGRKTDKAVRAFQRQSGLVVDGIVGTKTWDKLVGG